MMNLLGLELAYNGSNKNWYELMLKERDKEEVFAQSLRII